MRKGCPWLTLVPLWLCATAAAAVDWPQFGFDSRHSGVNPLESTLHRGNVPTLHVLYHVVLPSVADGAPAFLAGVPTASGSKDLLFVTTKAGHLLAVDAATGAIMWSRQPATAPNYTTSSPAVDPGRQYVYSYGLEGRVHKYQVADGAEVAVGGWPQLATLKPSVEKGSSALSVATTVAGASFLYVANGGYPGDAGDYQGHVTAIALASGAQRVFDAACSDQTVHFVLGGTPDCVQKQTAIWARAGVVYDSDNDRLFMATGNGLYDGHLYWGDSVFALHPDGSGNGLGQPLDAYTPTDFQQLQDADLDLGSTAPALLPVLPGSVVAHVGLQGGKDAKLRLIDLDDLSRAGGPGHVGGELQTVDLPQGGEVLTMPAIWTDPLDGAVWAFVANANGISGLQATVVSSRPVLTPRWTVFSGGSSPIVADGVLYYAGGGALFALDPVTGATLWSDTSIGGIHWESPIVVNGRLYVTDEGSQLWAYGPSAPAPASSFFTVTPCRLVDTRGPAGPRGGPALLGNGARRTFAIAGQCGIPADAVAVALNVTVDSPTVAGDLRVAPAGIAALASTVNFRPGRARANNTVVGLTGNPLGSVWVQTDTVGGSTHLILDVTGYFR
ncbi:MAG TPA: PQQ-binding-like beta-propeller repeat protein [Vicinamibacteria bacterium]|nr:PQQ-binding-like beta-propeller repeat protein [Vicinamibacteria bacterium]